MARRPSVRQRPSLIQIYSAYAVALFVLLQTPLFTFPVEYTDNRTRNVPMSPVEVVVVSLLKTNPELLPATQYVLLPGVWFKEFSKVVAYCIYKEPGCSTKPLTDIQHLLDQGNLLELVPAFMDIISGYKLFMQSGAGIVVIATINMLFNPANVKLALIGQVVMGYAIFMCNCMMLPTFIFLAMLCGASVLVDDSMVPKPPAAPSTSAEVAIKKAADQVKASPSKRTGKHK